VRKTTAATVHLSPVSALPLASLGRLAALPYLSEWRCKVTIGERIDKLTEEYIALYESLKKDPVLADKAAMLAKHDLIIQRYTADAALDNLSQHIKNDGGAR
jgi:hypothetical protein